MQQHSTRSLTIATGLAMFSMFFGAGNVVFPLSLGRYAQEYTVWAMLGLGLSAVIMPFVGVMGLALYNGSYNKFFGRLGKGVGFVLALLCLLLIGPGGAAPRTITVAHATIHLYLPWLTLPVFSLIFCTAVFLMTWRPTRIIDILGYVLTPVLLVSLSIIIIKGIIGSPDAGPSPGTRWQMFASGWQEGYHTMDVLGAFFFSHVALLCLKREVPEEVANDPHQMIRMLLKSSCIGAICLGAIYGGVSLLTSFYGAEYMDVSEELLLGTIARDQLGLLGGVVASVAVSFACLTTAIALCSVSAEFLERQILLQKVGYVPCLIVTLLAMFIVSTLSFQGIKNMVGPILNTCYPALIVLCVVNIGHKLYGWQRVHIFFWPTLVASIFIHWSDWIELLHTIASVW